jgi:hypothetical protein
LGDFFFFDLPIASQTFESIADEAENFTTLESSRPVCIIFIEDGVNGLA